MNALKIACSWAALVALVSLAGAQTSVETHLGAQSAADVLRDVADAEGAFIASGMLKPSYNKDDLASLAQYPDDEIVVVSVKGSDLRQAFERAISLHPQANSSFLQVSGFEIAFDPNAATGQRIRSVSTSSGKLEDGKEYKIAMPSSLGRGGYGYFRLWDRNKIVRTLDTTVAKVLAGRKMTESKPRWVVQS